jgi:putative ABC transport system ATP-binding protein
MQIELQNIVPVPLKDRFAQRTSGVWDTNICFKQGERVKIKAPSGTGKTTFVHILYQLRDKSNVIDAMAAKLGVTHILHQRAGLCSYGEQQRVAIIRALVQPFSWLVMDEPFSHLDQANITRAAALINEECALRGAGFILTGLDDDDYFTYDRQVTL